MEAPGHDEEAEWKLLTRISYLASRKSQAAELLRKQADSANFVMQSLATASKPSHQRLAELVKQMHSLSQPIVKDACEELATLTLSALSERFLASERYHQVVELQLLRRIVWLQAASEAGEREAQLQGSRAICKMCHLSIDYQRMEYLKDSIEHRVDLFAKPPVEAANQGLEYGTDDGSFDMIERILSRKNEVLSTEASNLTFFLTEALKATTAPLTLPVKMLSPEELSLMGQSSTMVVSSAIRTLNQNFAQWVKKQLTPIMLGICKAYYRKTRTKEQQQMKSQEVQTMENKAVMSTRAFELRIDAMNKELSIKKLEADSLIQDSMKLRMQAQKTKVELQTNVQAASSQIAKLQVEILQKTRKTQLLQASLVESNQRLKESSMSVSMLKVQLQQQNTREKAAGRKSTKPARLSHVISVDNTRISAQTYSRQSAMEQIQEETDVPAGVELPDNCSSQQDNMHSKACSDDPKEPHAAKEKRQVAQVQLNARKSFNVPDQAYIMELIPLDSDSPVIEQVCNVKNALAHVVANTSTIPTTRHTSVVVHAESAEEAAGRRSDGFRTIQSNQGVRQLATTAVEPEFPAQEDSSSRAELNQATATSSFYSKPSLKQNNVQRTFYNKQLMLTGPASALEQGNLAVVDRRNTEILNTRKQKVPIARHSAIRDLSTSLSKASKGRYLGRNAATGQNTPRSRMAADQSTAVLVQSSAASVRTLQGKENNHRSYRPSIVHIESVQQTIKIRQGHEEEQKRVLNSSYTNFGSAQLLPEFNRSGFNFVPQAKKTLQAKVVGAQQNQLRLISHEEFGVDDLELFMGLAEAYRFETVSQKRRLKATVEPTEHDGWLSQFFTYFDRQRRTNHQLYTNLKNFLSRPYQTAVNRLYNSADVEAMGYAQFHEQMRRILMLHHKCEQLDHRRRLCAHVCSFLVRVGFQVGGPQSVLVKPLLPALDH